MKAQIKFVVEKEIADRFKRAVVARRGKLDLSREGENAMRLYLRELEKPVEPRAVDSLLGIIGIASSRGTRRPNALSEKRALYS